MQAGRPIDLLLFGVPRSGTTALVRALNLHPDVFCGMEFLNAGHDHASVRYPDSFLARDGLTENQQRMLQAQVQAKPAPIVLGNKQPRYYFNLDQVVRQLDSPKLLWLYRSPSQYCSSWNRRAANHQDDSWHRGQTGVFGIVELLICIEAVLELNQPVLVLPYDAVFFRDPSSIDMIFAYLGVEPGGEPRRRFEAELFCRPKIAARARTNVPMEVELLGALGLERLGALLGRGSPFPFDSVRDEVVGYVAWAKLRVLETFRKLSVELSPPELVYFEQWKARPAVRQFLESVPPRGRLWRALGMKR